MEKNDHIKAVRIRSPLEGAYVCIWDAGFNLVSTDLSETH